MLQCNMTWVRAVGLLALVTAGALPADAGATPAFDPTTPEATFSGTEPVLTDADGLPMWDRIERLWDAGALFRQEDFPPGHAWGDDEELAPHAATLFGDATPHSGRVLLHFAPGWLTPTQSTPVLLLPGAGTNASGVLAVLARQLAAGGHAVFALSFAHPHGDNFQQAEQVANAIARIRSLTGAAQVDLVGHSKGGVVAAIYLSHTGGQGWGTSDRAAAYAAGGTPYRGDVRRFVAVAAPFGGIDTPFRWTAPSVAAVDEDPLAPVPWHTWYTYSTANLFVTQDLRDRDLGADGLDAWPGQAQLLADWSDVHALPGSRVEFGVYAAQPDWYTTYEGGLGFWTGSDGLAAVRDEAGSLVAALGPGIDPGVSVACAAGTFPFLALDRPAIVVDPFGGDFASFPGQADDFYQDFFDALLADDFPDLSLTDDDIQGMRAGLLAPGEISGLSDGVVFEASAMATAGLLSRGAPLLEARTFSLSHLDLLFASPELGAALVAQGDADPANAGYLRALGQRWIDADSVGWIRGLLADPDAGDDDDSAGSDDDDLADDDDSAPDDDDLADDDDVADDDDGAPEAPFLEGCGPLSRSHRAGGARAALPARRPAPATPHGVTC
jgi:triacylglycerol lipase